MAVASMVAAPAFAAANDAKVTSAGGRAALDQKSQAGGKVRVIVTLNLRRAFRPPGHLPADQAQDQRSAIGEAQSQLARELAGAQPGDVKHFRETPQSAMTVTPSQLDRLLNSPSVQSVAEDEVNVLHLDSSVPRIGASALAQQGLNGAGAAVAIIDTGVDKTHPFLSGAVVSEACFSTADAAWGISPLCPGGVTSSTATGSAQPYASGACPAGGCDHGTHVAGITAGRYNGGFTGVAPGASIIAIQVFSRVDNASICGGVSTCVLAYTSNVMSALQRVIDLRTTYNIASVNMSLGGGQYASFCDSDPRKAYIDTLRSYNIATVISSGNNGYTAALAAPACISSAISVGATTDVNGVASYSNSASFLSILAPGSSIQSSIPGAAYADYNGTSMAAPHVAGAWALVRQARPNASVSDVYTAIVNTGQPIADAKIAAIVKPRIRVDEATAALPFSGNGKVGVFRNGWWYLDANGNGTWDNTALDKALSFGQSGDLAVTGDWNGDGKTKIGVFRNGFWYLDYNGNGTWEQGVDKAYSFGMPGDVPVVGDWNHDGKTKVGVFRSGQWYLDYNGNGTWDNASIDRNYSFGGAGDVPVAGDWSGNGFTKIGVFRSGAWYLDYNGNGAWDNTTLDTVYSFGMAGDVPVAGDWNGKGVAKIGVFRNGNWYLDYQGSGLWSGTIADQVVNFGMGGDKPVIGKTWN